MKYEVIFTAKARDDLFGVFEYIAYKLKSVQNAAGQFERIRSGVAALEKMPERFRVYDKEPWKDRGLRIMPIDNYLIFYIPDSIERTVTVIRIMYKRRDVDEQLNE